MIPDPYYNTKIQILVDICVCAMLLSLILCSFGFISVNIGVAIWIITFIGYVSICVYDYFIIGEG